MFRKFGGLAAGVVRRRALTLIPATASGCTVARGTLAPGSEADLLPGTDVCRIVPAGVAEPRELEPALVRRDISEGRPGVSTVVRLQVVDAGCRPVPNARVDVWHCDATGACPSRAEDPAVLLRGTQFSDERGTVEFATIFPGGAAGRPARISFAVTPTIGTSCTFAGEIDLPEAISTYVHETVPAYRDGDGGGVAAEANHETPPTLNAAGAPSEAYLAQVIVAIDAGDAEPATVH